MLSRCCRKGGLVELETVCDEASIEELLELGYLLASVITHIKLPLSGDDLVVFLILQGLITKCVVANDPSTRGLMCFNLR